MMEGSVKEMRYTAAYASPLGGITLASDGERLCGLWFDGQKYFAATLSGEREERDLPVLRQAKRWLDQYFSGEFPDFTPPLRLEGSPFRQAVWGMLLQIPYGRVAAYGEIAAALEGKLGKWGGAAQAVGGAVGHNPISIIVPCHRVVGSGGSLTGYAGGLDKKRALLALEGVGPGPYFDPKKGAAL